MKRWHVILSTISFNKYLEITSTTVHAEDEADAERCARALGLDQLLGFKYQRVEEIPEPVRR
jgi:uncharacterized caspase-like protein